MRSLAKSLHGVHDDASRPAPEMRPRPSSLLTGWDHLELWVGNARAVSHFLQAGFGFECVAYSGPETGVRDRVGYLLEQGTIRLLVSAGLDERVRDRAPRAPPRRRRADRRLHDDRRRRRVRVRRTAGRSRRRVARTTARTSRARCARASIATLRRRPGTRSSTAEATPAGSPLASRPRACRRSARASRSGSTAIDHVVANVEEGRLDEWSAWYARVFGFTELRHFDADQISTEYSALRSTVMWNGGDIKLPINEPAPGRRKSQIQEYLDSYHGPGVQHIALATPDIVQSVDELKRRGVRFLVPPSTYYEDARSRCAGPRPSLGRARKARHPRRRRRWRLPAAGVHRDVDGSTDAVPRDDPTRGGDRFR